MLKYFLALFILVSCDPTPANEEIISKDLQDAIQNKDSASVSEIAKRDLERLRGSVTDSSFAALLDANLALQSFQFKIEKLNTKNRSIVIPDSLFLNADADKLHSFILRVYGLVLQKTANKNDIAYFNAKMLTSFEDWKKSNFSNRTMKELKISTLLIQKDLAIASAIINNVDSRQIREDLEAEYNQSVKILREN